MVIKREKRTWLAVIFMALIGTAMVAGRVFAQGVVECGDDGPCNMCEMIQTINRIIDLALAIVGGASVLAIIIAGIMYMVSAGSPDQMQTAKKAVTYAVIGLVFVVCAWLIVNVVGSALGYQESLFGTIDCSTTTSFRPGDDSSGDDSTGDDDNDDNDDNQKKNGCESSTTSNCDSYNYTDCHSAANQWVYPAGSTLANEIMGKLHSTGYDPTNGPEHGSADNLEAFRNWAAGHDTWRGNNDAACNHSSNPCAVSPKLDFLTNLNTFLDNIAANCGLSNPGVNTVMGGTHSCSSAHWDGQAIDFNTNPYTDEQKECMGEQCRQLGFPECFYNTATHPDSGHLHHFHLGWR